MSLKPKAHPSKTARVMCPRPCFIESPQNTPRALPFQVGVIAPLRHGRKTSPSEPGGTPSASAVNAS